MVSYELIYSPDAAIQIHEIGIYVFLQTADLDLSDRVVESIRKAARTISPMPYKHPLWPNPPSLLPSLRYLQSGNYVVLFTVDDDARQVSVIAVLHHARNIQAYLERTFA